MGFVDFEATLNNFDGDLELFSAISKIFLEDAPGIAAELNRCVLAEDLRGTSETLHKLKGLVANFHATRLVQELAAGEVAAKEGRLVIDFAQSDNIARQIVEISCEIQEYLRSSANE